MSEQFGKFVVCRLVKVLNLCFQIILLMNFGGHNYSSFNTLYIHMDLKALEKHEYRNFAMDFPSF